jgi:glycosyltransferase involved in cell wall biosynthesis
MKVAIVCDWLTGIGGAERVVLELHRMFPEAPIYTSQYNPKKLTWFEDADVRTTKLQKIPKALKKFLPVLRARAFSKLDLSEYDLVISSSGAEAKYVKVREGATHVTYCHAPTHYYWARFDEYMKNPGFGWLNWLARVGLWTLIRPMRWWDHHAAERPDIFVANSEHTAKEIKKYYGREAVVVHPPVDLERFAVHESPLRQGFVITGRQTPYKKVDLAVEACTQVGVPLIVIGTGPEHARLKKLAGPKVTFLTTVTDEEMPGHLRSALAFIFPGVDDFGISAVEALAAGTPVIAYKAGGALDYIVEGETGLFFTKQTPESLADVISNFKADKFNPKDLQDFAKRFGPDAFQKKMTEVIKDATKKEGA